MSIETHKSQNLMTEKQLAERWGVKPLTVYRWEKDGKIPAAIYLGGSNTMKFYRVEDIEQYERGIHGKLKVKMLRPLAQLPTRGTPMAAGLDLYAADEYMIAPGGQAGIQTGIAVEIPRGYVGLIWPRSGLAARHGIDVLAGVIDADYRGEVAVILKNHGNDHVGIRTGDRIAQLIIQPVAMLEPVEVADLSETERGRVGFGSTGK